MTCKVSGALFTHYNTKSGATHDYYCYRLGMCFIVRLFAMVVNV